MSGLKINWDALGITTSLACAIHCALLPLFLSSLPLFGINIIHNLTFELGMIFLAFCIGSYSLYHGYKKHHHSFRPLLLFSFGIALLITKQIWHQWEVWFLIPAVICIVSAHVINFVPAVCMIMHMLMIAIIDHFLSVVNCLINNAPVLEAHGSQLSAHSFTRVMQKKMITLKHPANYLSVLFSLYWS